MPASCSGRYARAGCATAWSAASRDSYPSLIAAGLDSRLRMSGSKADRPYGNFPRYGVVPPDEPVVEAPPLGRRQRFIAWLRATTRRERIELLITAGPLVAGTSNPDSRLPKEFALGTIET